MVTWDPNLSDAQRFPLLTDAGRRVLKRLQEHPHAPRFNHRCGDRLTKTGLERVHSFQRQLSDPVARARRPGDVPPWVHAYADQCLRDVPFYRARGGSSADFLNLPTCSRADLGRDFASFVPDTQPLDDLIVYATSGTTGHPVTILSHPETSSMYLALLRAAVASRGVKLEGGERVSMVLVCAQQFTYTFATVSSYLDQAGFAKINLTPNPADWRDPADRARFLNDCDPEIYSGDPLAFLELAKLALRKQPKALVSTAMALLPGLRRTLEAHFGCPVIDLYSMNECRLIAAAEGGEDDGETRETRHRVVPHDIHVEIFDPAGRPCPPGVRGEVTLTGGRNPFLSLLRYRTGDFAELEFCDSQPALLNLEGRPPVLFRTTDGRVVNNIDVTLALRPFPLWQFRLHQNPDLSLDLRVRGAGYDPDELRAALQTLFPPGQELSIGPLPDRPSAGGKLVQYTAAAVSGAARQSALAGV